MKMCLESSEVQHVCVCLESSEEGNVSGFRK